MYKLVTLEAQGRKAEVFQPQCNHSNSPRSRLEIQEYQSVLDEAASAVAAACLLLLYC